MNQMPNMDSARGLRCLADRWRRSIGGDAAVDRPLVPLGNQTRDGASWCGLRGLHLLVALAVIFNFWSLRFERLAVAYPNDSGMHLQMTTQAMHFCDTASRPMTTGTRFCRWVRHFLFSTKVCRPSSLARFRSSSAPKSPTPGRYISCSACGPYASTGLPGCWNGVAGNQLLRPQCPRFSLQSLGEDSGTRVIYGSVADCGRNYGPCGRSRSRGPLVGATFPSESRSSPPSRCCHSRSRSTS